MWNLEILKAHVEIWRPLRDVLGLKMAEFLHKMMNAQITY